MNLHVAVGYTTVALSQTVTGKLPNNIAPPLPTKAPPSIKILTRLNLALSDAAQNKRLSALAQLYSLIAVRPINEKALAQACQTIDCDIISLDLSTRFPYHFKFKTLSAAISRGVRLEICYGPGVTGSGTDARRNLIGNATALIRATRGRGIIISSEAKQALGVRGPWDVINLACMWGMDEGRAKEAIGEEARKVVSLAGLKRTSWRGTVDVVYGGEKQEGNEDSGVTGTTKKPSKQAKGHGNNVKRKAPSDGGESTNTGEEPQLSKRELKRRAKKAKLEAVNTDDKAADETPKPTG